MPDVEEHAALGNWTMLKDETLESEAMLKLFNLNKENTRPVLLAVASSRSRSFALVELTTVRNRPTTNAAAPILKKMENN